MKPNIHITADAELKKQVSIGELEKTMSLILASFKEQFIKTNVLFEGDLPSIEVVLNKKTSALRQGCFLPRLSSHKILKFQLFYPIDKNEMDAVILHELMHGADLSNLKEKLGTFDRSKEFHLCSTLEDQLKYIENSGIQNFSIQWVFLHFLSTFRDEGIAILGEKLLGEKSGTISFEKAFFNFQKDINQVTQLCYGMKFHNRINSKQVRTIFEDTVINAYQYAEVIIYELLKGSIAGLEKMNLHDLLANNDPKEKLQLLKSALQLDLAEYIRELMKLKHKNTPLINSELLLSYCGVIQGGSSEHPAFFRQLYLVSHNNDKTGFTELIQSVCDRKMQSGEIKEKLDLFNQTSFSNDLKSEVRQLANEVFAKRNNNNKEVSDWALTYLLNKEDLIYDQLDYLGLQDDWMVMEAASSFE
jgi:hypothetical protein